MGSCCGSANNNASKKLKVVAKDRSSGQSTPKLKTQAKYKVNSGSRQVVKKMMTKGKVTTGKSNSKITSKMKITGGKSKAVSKAVSSASATSNTLLKGAKTSTVSPGSRSSSNITLQLTEDSSMISCLSSIVDSDSIPDMSFDVSPHQITRKEYQFRLDRTSALFSDSFDDYWAALNITRLYKDQTLPKTFLGVPVTPDVLPSLLNNTQVLEIMNSGKLSDRMKQFMVPPYTKINEIVDGVYLTGFYGMLQEEIAQKNITLIMNVTNSIPLYQKAKGGVISLRVPVVDSGQEPIGAYFDDAADIIEVNRRLGCNSVVHCMAGVSRSSTIILAYLIKYTTLNLRQAFEHCRATRFCIRPNMGFFRQLIEFERKLNSRSSTKMVEVKDKKSELKATVPDFYPSLCPDLFQMELYWQNNPNQ